ncbi:MAG: GMC family oxidoreductase, partial [Deltaproteobacteria bacterium]|nr:GMC family oxidoreductase [Deltaproteobacteria bacterium]
GGGSLVYANTLYVPPDAFFQAPQWAAMGDWKARLMPHYRVAQLMLGVTQNTFEGEPDRVLRSVAEGIGKGDSYVTTPVAVYFGTPNQTVGDPYFGGAGPERTGCNHCGGCMVGCRFGAKNTLDRNYLYFAEKLGAQVKPMRTVVDVRALPGGGYAVTHERTGAWLGRDRQVTTAARVVLSAGVLGTVKILLESRERGSLPGVSSALGRLVRTNSEAILGVTAGATTEPWSRGIAITSSIHPDERTHIEVVRYSEGSDALAPLTTLLTDGGPGAPRWARWLGNIARQPLTFAKNLWPFGRSRRGVFLLVMQTLDNSISLRLRRTWRSLWRRALDTDHGEGEPNPSYIPLANQLARVFAGKVSGVPQSSIMEALFDTPTTAHILGGAAIGASADAGVIDERNEVFGHPGLYVCDGSMIPANLGVNPSLTITAVTELAMSHIPVKEGATLRRAVDEELQARRVAEIEALAQETGSASLQRHLPVHS